MLLTRTVGALTAGVVAFVATGCLPDLTLTRTARTGPDLQEGVRSKDRRAGLTSFLRDLRAPRSGQQYFSVAVDGAKFGSPRSEVWVDGLKVVGNTIEGRLVPGGGQTCRIVKIDESEVCDWMIVEGGRVKGGATLRD
ncbi:MAG: DUF2314 domain-containing protein [Armatimonadetes bacterium]|nr:DUF2314 domain-containing protein [Armatimonadota bacterium]